MESDTATSPPSTPLQSPRLETVNVRAMIELPTLALEESYSLDDDLVTNVSDLVGKLSRKFDEAFPDDGEFDYDDCKLYPGLHGVFPISVINDG
jgi:hypothetical protein